MAATFRASVTFESARGNQPPVTWRGVVRGSPEAACRRAVVEAKRNHPGMQWGSLVVVVEKTVAETRLDEAGRDE